MAGFYCINDPDSTVCYKIRIASQAYTIGDYIMKQRTSDAIEGIPATASAKTTDYGWVALETVTSAATSLLVQEVTPRQDWGVDSTNNSNTNHNMLRAILTDKATVNNTGTDDTSVNAVVEQRGIIGAVSAKRLVVRFLTASIAA